jgi:hypothetical protein
MYRPFCPFEARSSSGRQHAWVLLRRKSPAVAT